jgi:predicted nuclease of restriction endonuclease-like (RecB) superfamily
MIAHGNADAPRGYFRFLDEVKERIRKARLRAAMSANGELIGLYWQIGKSIVERQRKAGWGKSIVERLSRDLRLEFPGCTGFSAQNIWKMRAFFIAWTDEVSNLSQPVRELDGRNLPSVVSEIPWGHNTELIFKLKEPSERLWYARKAIEHGWSRAVLVHQIESGLYERHGKAVTNFSRALPPARSDMAGQALKDPYVFDFLAMTDEKLERDLERGLVENVRRFLLELGVGFAFVGSQYHIEVEGEDFYIDLLFYHLALRCFVIIDLKTGAFKPEDAGKMGFYLSAVDDRLRRAGDNESIGIVLCKSRKRLIAEYALRNIIAPIGVSEYRLTREVPAELQKSLPTVEEMERRLKDGKRWMTK